MESDFSGGASRIGKTRATPWSAPGGPWECCAQLCAIALATAGDDEEFYFSDEEDFGAVETKKKRQGKKGLSNNVVAQEAALENEKAKTDKVKSKLGTGGRRKRTNVYTFGEAQYSKMGHDKRSMVSEPTLVGALLDKDVITIVYGARHAVALTADGHLFSWGHGGDGQLGHGDQSMQPVPRFMTSLAKEVIVKVSCGEVHTAAINRYGQLLTWGDSPAGQLGHGDNKMQVRPKVVEGLFGHTIVDVACGNLHTICVTEEGKVFSMGSGLGGRLGHKDEDERLLPTQIETLDGKGIRQVATEGSISLCLTAQGPVFPSLESVGKGDQTEEEEISTSQKIRALELQLAKSRHDAERATTELNNIKAEVKKWEYEVNNLEALRKKAMSENLKLSFDKAEKIDQMKTAEEQRQLMRQEMESFLKLPEAFEELYTKGVKQIVTGKSHLIALLDNGEVKCFGDNQKGQLGLGHKRKPKGDMRTIGKLRNKAIKMIAAGDYHSVALTYAGDVYTWGSSGNGQCGLGKKGTVTEPTRVNFKDKLSVRVIGAGSKHTVALTGDGEVYVWGRVDIGVAKGGGAGDKPLPTHVPALTRHVKKDDRDDPETKKKVMTGNMTTNEIKELIHVHGMDAKDVVEMLPNITEDPASQLLLTKEVNKRLDKDVKTLKKEMKEQQERFIQEEKEFRNNQAKAMAKADEAALMQKRKDISEKEKLLTQRKVLEEQLQLSVKELTADIEEVTLNMDRVNREKMLSVSQAKIDDKANLQKSLDDIMHDLEVARGLKDVQLSSSRKELEMATKDIAAISDQLDAMRVEEKQYEKYGLNNQLKKTREAVTTIMSLRDELKQCTVEALNTKAKKSAGKQKKVQGLTSILDKSNDDIDRLMRKARKDVAGDENIDPEVRKALAQLILDNGELRKTINSYTWGLMRNTIIQHEQLRSKVDNKGDKIELDPSGKLGRHVSAFALSTDGVADRDHLRRDKRVEQSK